jgi:hypothetical protein
VRNNILYLDKYSSVANKSNFTHDHNLYYLGNGTTLGFTLGSHEILADPQFVNLAGQDFHLRSSSPAIDAGVNLGYTLDFDKQSVPIGLAPEMGAYEYLVVP